MDKKKKVTIIVVISVVILALLGGIAYFYFTLEHQKKQNKAMLELANLDKQEMENEYSNFASQYTEMQKQITNEDLIKQLEQQKKRSQELLEELRNTKSTDAAEIARLKKELELMRKIMRTYIIQIDSLNQENKSLRNENANVRMRYNEATQQIVGLTNEKSSLSEKVAVAAQLDATGIYATPQNKRGKTNNKASKVQRITVGFTITKNVTAAAGMRNVFVRILKPDQAVLGAAGSFKYENKEVEYSMRKSIEYTGQEAHVTLYYNVSEYLAAGTYGVYIFCDGQMIGSSSFSLR